MWFRRKSESAWAQDSEATATAVAAAAPKEIVDFGNELLGLALKSF